MASKAARKSKKRATKQRAKTASKKSTVQRPTFARVVAIVRALDKHKLTEEFLKKMGPAFVTLEGQSLERFKKFRDEKRQQVRHAARLVAARALAVDADDPFPGDDPFPSCDC